MLPSFEEIHEVLFRTDMGFETADYLIDKVESHFKKEKNEEVNWENVKSVLKKKFATYSKTVTTI